MEYGISGYRSEHERYVNKNVVQLDYVQTDLMGDGSQDRVYLLAVREGDNLILDDISIVIELEKSNERQYYTLPISRGMGGSLHVEDFNHDRKKDIGVYVQTGGTGNQINYWIFFNQGDCFYLGFDSKSFESKMKFTVTYQPNYEVEVLHVPTNQSHKINLENRADSYLEAIYLPTGELKAPLKGVVAPVHDSDPIESKIYNNGYDLILVQRVLGRSHNDTLGYIQSYLTFDNQQYHVYKILISQ